MDMMKSQANSYWLYNVPWGMYKALMYIKERYGNPNVLLSENGITRDDFVTWEITSLSSK